MIKLKPLLMESDDTFQMFHGGNKWIGGPTIYPPKKNRYEGGPGLYFTNNYLTARKYSKGGKIVLLVDINKMFTDISKIKIPMEDMINFINSTFGMKNKKNIISDIQSYSNRTNKTDIPAIILNNLIVNWESGAGKIGLEVVKFFISYNIDAHLTSQSGNEQWLIVFNPNIIKRYEIINPRTFSTDKYFLPKIFI